MYFPSTKPLFTLPSRGCLDIVFALIWFTTSGSGCGDCWQVDSTQCWHWHSCPSPHSISGTFPSEEDRKVFAVIRYFWFWLMSGGRLHLSFFLWSFDGIRWATLVFTFHLSCFRFVTDDRIPESKLSRDLLLAVVCPTSVHTVHFPIRKFQISLQDWRTVCLERNWWVLGVRADLTLNILASNPTTSCHK